MSTMLSPKGGSGTPAGWKSAKLGDICEITMGTSPPGNTYNRDGVGDLLLNGPTEFGTRHPAAVQWTTDATRFAEPGDILFCVRGATTGRKNIADRRYCIGRGLAAIRGRDQLADTDFLWYVLDVVTNELVGRAAGSTFVNLSGAELMRFCIPLPPLQEQQRIAAMLKEQLAAVERARAAAVAQLEAAKALPAADLRAVFENAESGAWQRVRLGDAIHEMRYGTSNKASEQGYVTLRIPNVLGGAVGLSDLKRVSVSGRDFENLRLVNGDLLFVRTNGNPYNIGRSAVFSERDVAALGTDASKVIFASYLIRVRLDLSLLVPRFVQLYLQSARGRAELLSHCKTSAGQFNISTSGLAALTIPIPDLSVQGSVVAHLNAKIEAAAKVCLAIEKQLSGIDALTPALLRSAFQGRL